MLNKINKSDNIIICGDINARVGNLPIPGVVGTYGELHINYNGEELRQFTTYNKLKIMNTFFKKKEIHKYTRCERGNKSLIDYIIANEKIKNQVQDVRY